MVDSSSLLPAGLPADPALLPTLLDLLPMGVIYYTPVIDDAGTLTDLTLAYLNPAAQRMTRLPAQPGTTYRQQFPTTDDNGAWEFHRRTWLSGEPQHFQFYYDADGFDAYFRVASQRLGEGLLTIFTDTQDEVRSQAEQALLASQVRERAALAQAEATQREAEAAHANLANVFTQAPAMICLFDGPAHTFQFVNPPYQALVGERPLLGKPIAEAMPELAGQPIFGLLDHVYQTGETFAASEMLVQLDHHNENLPELEKRYYNFIYKARRNGQDSIDGILVFAYDVTAQVQAREQVQTLNEELAATNEEYQQANLALADTQQQLQQLNQELEMRVQVRTQQALAAQATVEAERQWLRRLFATMPAGIAILTGPELVYEFVNPRYQLLLPGRELLGRPIFEALPELIGTPLGALLRQAYDSGQTQEVHSLLVPVARADSGVVEDRYFTFVYQGQRDEQGRIIGVLLFVSEVTEQVLARRQVEQLNQELETRVQQRTQQLAAAQAAAERERAQLQALIAQAPVAIGLFEGEDLRVTSVNAVISALWGYTPAQVLGRPLLEAVPELQGQGFDDLLRQVLHTQVPFIGTETPATLRRNGQLQTTYFNFVYQPLYEAEGQVSGVLCVAVDVTEQVLAREQVQELNEELAAINEELRASNEEYLLANAALSESQLLLRQLNKELEARVLGRTRELQNMFAQAPMALVVLRGPRFLIEQANAQAELIWGVAVADVLGRPHFEAIPGSAGQGFEEMLTDVLVTGEAVVLREVPIELVRDHTGRPNLGYYNVAFKPLFDEGQPQATGIVVMWTEATDQVQAREQVQSLNEELAAINEELMATNEELHESNTQLTRTNVDLDNFIYTASHDLKAPITNIEGLLLALEHELPAAARTGDVPLMLTMMQEATERFRRTINHLTDLSRLQKEHTPDSDAVALAPVVEAVRLDLTPLLAQTRSQLTVSIPAGLTVTFAEKNLRSVVYNLLSNAFKYHHPDRVPEVTLRVRQADGYTLLEVQDNGLGLDLSRGEEQLFGMFQRLHTHVEGTGVGLYMVKRVLENAGNRIEVISELGQGSTFRVYFHH